MLFFTCKTSTFKIYLIYIKTIFFIHCNIMQKAQYFSLKYDKK